MSERSRWKSDEEPETEATAEVEVPEVEMPEPTTGEVTDDSGPKILRTSRGRRLIVPIDDGEPITLTSEGAVVEAEHVERVLAAAASCEVRLTEARA